MEFPSFAPFLPQHYIYGAGNSRFVFGNKTISTSTKSAADPEKEGNLKMLYISCFLPPTSTGPWFLNLLLWMKHSLVRFHEDDWLISCSFFTTWRRPQQGLWICSSWTLMELVAPDSVNGRLMQLCLCGTHIVCASGSIKKEPDQLLPVQSRDSAQSRLVVR